MTSKEIVRRVIRHAEPPRLAWDYLNPLYRDIQHVGTVRLHNPEFEQYDTWGEYDSLKIKTGFSGEIRQDSYGNIYGRLNGKTKGECILGSLQESWEQLASYQFPTINRVHADRIVAMNLQESEKYVLTGLPMSVFSVLRDMRRMDNALMDTVSEQGNVEDFLEKLMKLTVEAVHLAADCGVDGIMIADDWGMQYSPFISPRAFRLLFKPAYKIIADACHERNLDFMLHSCGYVLPLVDDMIEAGIDVFQFDQPEAAGSDLWSEKYGKKVAFYSPVDIQKIMVTGDREFIEQSALHMAEVFKKCGGSLIAKDYPSWGDINVEMEWAKWAMDVIVANSAL